MNNWNRSPWCIALFGLWVFTFGPGCATSEPTRKTLSHTERARMLVEIGNGALIEGDATGALQSLAQAEQVAPNLPELHHSKALAYYAKHDIRSAIVSAKKAVSIKGDYSDANNTLGKLLIDVGNYEQAIPPLEAAARDPLYRESYKAWTNLGILKYRQGDNKKSDVFMTKAIQESPGLSCIAHYYRGHIRLKDLHLVDAIREYEEATKKMCSSFGDAHFALGLALQKNHQYDRARKTFLEIQARYPNTKLSERALDQLKFIP